MNYFIQVTLYWIRYTQIRLHDFADNTTPTGFKAFDIPTFPFLGGKFFNASKRYTFSFLGGKFFKASKQYTFYFLGGKSFKASKQYIFYF